MILTWSLDSGEDLGRRKEERGREREKKEDGGKREGIPVYN